MGGGACLQYLLVLAQLGIAIAVAVVVRQDLWYQVPGTEYSNCYSYWYGRVVCYGEWVCLLTDSSTNYCSYTWVVAGLSMILSFVIAIAQAFRGKYGGRGCTMSSVIAALMGLGWWIAAGVITTREGKDANSINIPVYMNAKNSRTAVYAMAWTEVGLFFVSTLIALADCRAKPKPQQQHQPAAAAAGGYPQGAYVAGGGYQQPYPGGYAQPPPPGYAYPPPGAQYAPPPYPPPAATGYAVPPPYPPPAAAGASYDQPPKVV